MVTTFQHVMPCNLVLGVHISEYCFTLKMDAAGSPETPVVIYQLTCHYLRIWVYQIFICLRMSGIV
jgi:hypothetical protein